MCEAEIGLSMSICTLGAQMGKEIRNVYLHTPSVNVNGFRSLSIF